MLLDGDGEKIASYLKNTLEKNIAVICYTEDEEAVRASVKDAEVYLLGSREDELTQAKRLFALLREADKKEYYTIYAPLPKKSGLSLALYNRMIRAAAHRIIKL